jgi:hypothetical protein
MAVDVRLRPPEPGNQNVDLYCQEWDERREVSCPPIPVKLFTSVYLLLVGEIDEVVHLELHRFRTSKKTLLREARSNTGVQRSGKLYRLTTGDLALTMVLVTKSFVDCLHVARRRQKSITAPCAKVLAITRTPPWCTDC